MGNGTSEALCTAYRWLTSVKCGDGVYNACKGYQNEYSRVLIDYM